MRIGVDACCWSNRRGFGRFTRELLSALLAVDQNNEYLFFVDKDTAATEEFPEGVNLVVAQTQVSPIQAASASGRRSLGDLWALTRQVMKHEVDLFFFPAVYSYFPIVNRTKVVVTIHDMIADNHPDSVFPNQKLKLFWKAKQQLAVRQARMILTVSQFSKRQIVDFFKIPESRVQAISEGPNAVFGLRDRDEKLNHVLRHYRLDPGRRFLMYVGGISPHKNLGALIDAYHQVQMDSRFSDVKLVLVGDYKNDSFFSDYPRLVSQVEQLGLRENVILTGFVEDQELAYLYNAASLLVLPSLEEGFGLPIVEGMACGTPVVASDRGSLPEILGDAGRFFDPYRPETIATTLRDVLGDATLRQEMSRRGLARAKQFTWEQAAKKTLGIFNELAR